MKHIRILSLSLALVMLLAACGKDNADSSQSSSASAPDVSVSMPEADVSVPDVSLPEADISAPDASAPQEQPEVQPEEVPEPEAEKTLTLNKSDFTLKAANASYKLRATVTGVENAKVIWTSSKEEVATVSEDGTVTAVSAGIATITAAVEGTDLTAACTVRCRINTEEQPQQPAPEQKPEENPAKPAPEAKPEEAPAKPAPAGVDLNAFYQTIFTDPENSPALVPMDAGALDAFYPGLTAISTKQRVAYMPMMTAVPCEIVMVECTNSADVAAVKGIFKARIAAQVDNHFNYPMVIETWEKEARVVSNGNFVALFVVSGMTNQVVSSFNALF